MSRNKQSPLEGMIDIAAHLPWKTGLVLALIAYLGFHHAATLPLVPIFNGNEFLYGTECVKSIVCSSQLGRLSD